MRRKENEKSGAFRSKKFCSIPCRMKALSKANTGKPAHNNRQVLRICAFCGKTTMVAPSQQDRRYCNRICMTVHYRSGIMSKESHWNWQGGITDNTEREVKYPGYGTWRKLVYERDKYMCQVCAAKRNLCAHHVKAIAEYPALVLVVDNGIILCVPCHKEVHYGKYRDISFELQRDRGPNYEETRWKISGTSIS